MRTRAEHARARITRPPPAGAEAPGAHERRSGRITILSRALRASGPGGSVRAWNRRMIGTERSGFAHDRSDRFRRPTGSLSAVGFVFQRPIFTAPERRRARTWRIT